MQGKTLTALALVVSDPRGALPVEQPPAESEDIAEEDDTLKAAPSPAGGTLILCPKSTLHSTWLAEIKRRLVGTSISEGRASHTQYCLLANLTASVIEQHTRSASDNGTIPLYD